MAIPQPPFRQNSRPTGLALSLLICAVLACGGTEPSSAQARSRSVSSAAATPSLGSAANFAVLAGTAVTCTSATVTGNVGVSPGNVVTQTSCPVTGTIHAGDTAAAQAHNDFVTAYDAFKALPCTRTLTTLDSQRLSPGIYCFDAAATSAGGVLTLDGPSNGTWIFKIGTLGTGALTGTNFSVVTTSGAAPSCGSVYWWVADAVTLTDSKFVGTILAGAAITLTRGTFNGNALAKGAAMITGTAATGCALGGGSSGEDTCDEDSDHHGGGGHEDGDDDKGDDDRGGHHHHGHHNDHGNKGGRGK